MSMDSDTTAAPDATAPYGYNLDGSARKGPGGRPAGKRARARTRPPGPAAPPRRPAKTSSKRDGSTDYRPALIGLMSIPAMGLQWAGLDLDAAALLMNAGEIAEAVNTTAKDRAEIAALCDRFLQVGPYGLIFMAVTKLGGQIAENHGWLPPQVTRKLGAVPRVQLKAHIRAMTEAAEAEAAAYAAADAEAEAAAAAAYAAAETEAA